MLFKIFLFVFAVVCACAAIISIITGLKFLFMSDEEYKKYQRGEKEMFED